MKRSAKFWRRYVRRLRPEIERAERLRRRERATRGGGRGGKGYPVDIPETPARKVDAFPKFSRLQNGR